MFRATKLVCRARRHFVDGCKVLLASGSGGDGASVMAHEHGNELAGPGGGNGGNGGNVMLRCSKRLSDLGRLEALGSQLVAEAGRPGVSRQAHGRRGRDLWLEVPMGTVVTDVDTNEVIFDLNEDGMEVVLLEGGQGGKGNAAFANKWHHSPTESTRGLPGNTVLAHIELKTIADCGLIGYPNAGKSSLLSAISSSKPTVAPYAFTTLRPYVGVIYDLYGNTCRVADIPGLIEGAYEDRGLGHRFLRHVERAKSLAFVVDMSNTFHAPGEEVLEPWEVVEALGCELDFFSPGLRERGIMVFANKMDVEVDHRGVSTVRKLEELRRRVPLPVFPVSAALGMALGARHAQTGLDAALTFMCGHVFQQKKNDAKLVEQRRAREQAELDKAFRFKNNGVYSFSPSEEGAEEEEVAGGVSLVDQQLALIGGSGLGDTFDGYEHSAAQGELHAYRDLTMKGKYWRLTRGDNDRLSDERWK